MAKIAFDIDDTLYKVEYEEINGEMIPVRQVPDYEVIQLLITLFRFGNHIFVWSAGGMEYSMSICDKLGIRGMVQNIPKDKRNADAYGIDITFDDQEVTLGKINIRIPREKYGDNDAS